MRRSACFFAASSLSLLVTSACATYDSSLVNDGASAGGSSDVGGASGASAGGPTGPGGATTGTGGAAAGASGAAASGGAGAGTGGAPGGSGGVAGASGGATAGAGGGDGGAAGSAGATVGGAAGASVGKGGAAGKGGASGKGGTGGVAAGGAGAAGSGAAGSGAGGAGASGAGGVAGAGGDAGAAGSSAVGGAAGAGAAGGSAGAGGGAPGTGCTTGPAVVISQVYGGGGNVLATFQNDYVEVFNRSDHTVDLSSYAVEYASAMGTTWAPQNLTPLSGMLPAGGYFLVELASGGTNGAALPTPDAMGAANLSSTAGKVALLSTTTPSSGACPADATVVDLVPYGSTSCMPSAPSLSSNNAKALLRKNGGCSATGSAAADFSTGTPSPSNGATTPALCAVCQ